MSSWPEARMPRPEPADCWIPSLLFRGNLVSRLIPPKSSYSNPTYPQCSPACKVPLTLQVVSLLIPFFFLGGGWWWGPSFLMKLGYATFGCVQGFSRSQPFYSLRCFGWQFSLCCAERRAWVERTSHHPVGWLRRTPHPVIVV